jgi:hypothetical protein
MNQRQTMIFYIYYLHSEYCLINISKDELTQYKYSITQIVYRANPVLLLILTLRKKKVIVILANNNCVIAS